MSKEEEHKKTTKQMTVYFPKELYNEIQRLRELEMRSASKQVIALVLEALERRKNGVLQQ